MNNSLFNWIRNQKVPLCISLGFGILAGLLYFVAGYVPGDGRLEAWYMIYFVSLPASWLAHQIMARVLDYIPGEMGDFLYVVGTIVAGMVWFF